MSDRLDCYRSRRQLLHLGEASREVPAGIVRPKADTDLHRISSRVEPEVIANQFGRKRSTQH